MNLEIALYHVKSSPDNERPLIIDTINRTLGTINGFQHRTTLQSTDDPQLLVDLVRWRDLPAALQAAKQVPTLPAFAPFGALIDSLPLFAHMDPAVQHGSFTWDDMSPCTELAIYTFKQISAADRARFTHAYDAVLERTEGYQGRLVLTDSEVPHRQAELVRWESLEAALKAEKALLQNPELLALMGLVERVEMVQRFTLF